MKIRDVIAQTGETVTVRQVFGEAYERNGVSVIPVASVHGGAGGGDGEGAEGEGKGSGGGFGMRARPVGALLIRGDEVTWRPVVDINRIVLGGQIVAVVALLTLRSIARSRAKTRRLVTVRSLAAGRAEAKRR